VDLGTNRGIQIRKLYESELYPDAAVLPVFRRVFAEIPRNEICSIGFEPNPHLTPTLKVLEWIYNQNGFRVKIHTEIAVSNQSSSSSDFLVVRDTEHADWASGFHWRDGRTHSKSMRIQVESVDVAEIFQQIPTSSTVLVKVDTEGAEYLIIPRLVHTYLLCRKISAIMVEWHPDFIPDPSLNLWNHDSFVRRISYGCPTEILNLDDESYAQSDFRLPIMD